MLNISQVLERTYPRRDLCKTLRAYQECIGNMDTETNDQLDKLAREDSVCVVTGQQVGLMGGPSLTVAKATACVKHARARNAVPVFWAATEDHDVHEVATTYLLGPRGDLERYRVALPEGHAVETLSLTEAHREVIDCLLTRLQLEFSWSQEVERYAEFQIRALVELFRGSGLLFLEPSLLRPLAGPFFERELSQASAMRKALCATSCQLRRQGRPTPLKIREGLTNLFWIGADGRRLPLRDGEGADVPPEQLSPNVAARPLLQSYVLPTVAYVAGPSEALYWTQLEGLFAEHSLPMPDIVPRFSLTCIPAEAQRWLELLQLSPEGPLPESCKALGSKDPTKRVLEEAGVPTYALHYLRLLLHPKGKPQERVLNLWGFKGPDSPALVGELLASPLAVDESHLCLTVGR